MMATAIKGEYEGETLREVPVTWTTWGDWRFRHPDTRVLSRETGYARDYSRDPYGSYAPRSGYYADDFTRFPPLETNYRLHPKAPVVGVRTADAAAVVSMETVRIARLLRVGALPEVVFVYDQRYDAAYAYRDPEERRFEASGATVTGPDGEHAPDDLPAERLTAVRAMWFAWIGFYPDSTVRV